MITTKINQDLAAFTAKAAELGYTAIIEGGELYSIVPTDRNSYIPEVYLPRMMFGEKYQTEIQTTAYGAKSAEEISLIIEGYQNAQKLAALIEKFLG